MWESIEIDSHATWGRIDIEGDSLVEVAVAALQKEFSGQFLAGFRCVQLVETGYLRDELPLNEKKANAKTPTVKVPTENGNVRCRCFAPWGRPEINAPNSKAKLPGTQTPSRSNHKPEAQALNLNPHGLNPLAGLGVSGFVALGLGFRVLRLFRG